MGRGTREIAIAVAVVILALLAGCSSPAGRHGFPELRGDYLGQPLPGNEPALFAPGLVTTGLYTRDLVVAPEGDELYFSVATGSASVIMVARRVEGLWLEPRVAPFSGVWRDFEPFVTADGERLLFLSNRPPPGQEPKPRWGHQNIWQIHRTAGGWSEPEMLPPPINTEASEFFPSVTSDGTLYFTRGEGGLEARILRSRWSGGRFSEPEQLPPEVNSVDSQYNAFVSPDEDILLFAANGRQDSRGGSDCYVSFRGTNDVWSGPFNLGDAVNDDGDCDAASLSPDGHVLFFMSTRRDAAGDGDLRGLTLSEIQARQAAPRNGLADIYWVDAGLLDELRPSARASRMSSSMSVDVEAVQPDLHVRQSSLTAPVPPGAPAPYQTLSKYDPSEWGDLVDAAWGPGPPTADKLAVFDQAWRQLDQRYGAFMNLDVDLETLRHRYRQEIADGVSLGRWVAILNRLSLAMLDAHTRIQHRWVNLGTSDPQPGLPLIMVGAWLDTGHFGASLTPLPDDSLLVIRVLEDHPLGLEVGDVILGYDGIPWKDLYQQLVASDLPIAVAWVWGSTAESMRHAMLMSAGLNWHLFDTIDVVKHDSGETLHLATAPLARHTGRILGNEQLPVPGVPMYDPFEGDWVSWGVVDGTDIGYIYVASWSSDPDAHISEQFYDAVHDLMFEHPTRGLILDFRLNTGGWMLEAHPGYSLLFDARIQAVSFDVRGAPEDHLDMVPHPTYNRWLFEIPGNPDSFYDQPIAVLTGPGAVSNGDWESLRMQLHPRVRVFGKPSNGAFTLADRPALGPEWIFTNAIGTGYLIDGHRYMAHTPAPVDEEVWLTLDDVVEGRDTVVEAAIRWIRGQHPRHPGGRRVRE